MVIIPTKSNICPPCTYEGQFRFTEILMRYFIYECTSVYIAIINK